MSGFGVHRFRWWHYVALGAAIGVFFALLGGVVWLGLVDGGGR